MRDEPIGRFVRMLRHRRGWRQVDLCARARRPRSALVALEAGRLGRLSVDLVRDFIEALGGGRTLEVSSGASDPRLLIDAGHALIGEHWKRRLERWGWSVRVEESFNRYGDRGRIDLLAFHAAAGVLVVIEVKTVLWDIQAMLGSMSVKCRVAPFVAGGIGWRARRVVPLLLVAASTTVRRRLAEHESLFSSHELRGRTAITWLRDPTSAAPVGAIILTSAPHDAGSDRRRAGRRRVRRVAQEHAPDQRRHDARGLRSMPSVRSTDRRRVDVPTPRLRPRRRPRSSR